MLHGNDVRKVEKTTVFSQGLAVVHTALKQPLSISDRALHWEEGIPLITSSRNPQRLKGMVADKVERLPAPGVNIITMATPPYLL